MAGNVVHAVGLFSGRVVGLLGGLAAGALVGMVVLGGCSGAARFERESAVSASHAAGGPIEARTENGSVTVSVRAGGEVEIRAQVRAMTQERADATVVMAERQPDGRLMIEVRWPDGKRQSNEACSLDIGVPEAVAVRLFTSNGDIDAKGMAGEGVFHTSNGSVVVSGHSGSVDAKSSNGDIDVRSDGGAVSANTSNGSVAVRLGAGGGPVDAVTSNGRIRLEVGAGFVGEVEASTSNGSVEASGGRIVRQDKRSATVQFGEGGAKSRLRSSNGKVMVVGE